jgi:hypothetical protein
MLSFTHKLVAILNEKLETGVAMNALAHMSLGLGGMLGKDRACLSDYYDATGGTHPSISDMPFIILKATAPKIRDLRHTALHNNCNVVDFTSAMTIGTHIEQKEAMLKMPEEDLVYYGIALYGPYDLVSQMTRTFSLWR